MKNDLQHFAVKSLQVKNLSCISITKQINVIYKTYVIIAMILREFSIKGST